MHGTCYLILTLKRLCCFTLLLFLLAGSTAHQLVAQDREGPVTESNEPAPSGQQPLTVTEQVIRDVLEPLQRGIEEHDPAKVLDVFNHEQTPDYARFRDHVRAFFSEYETIRFRYRVLQVTSEKDTAFAIAEVDMAAKPMDETRLEVRRSTQMRFELKLGSKGWKLVGFKPGDFFML